MSFILDALKKLEREKATREAGVMMVGPVQWGAPDRQRQRRRLALALAGLAVLVAGALWWLASRPAPAPDAPAATTGPIEAPPLPTAAAPRTAFDATSVPALRPSPAPPEAAATGKPPEVAAPAPRPVDLPSSQAEGSVEEASARLDEAFPMDVDEIPAPPTPEFSLTAISERDGQPIAILNDRLVREGDSFNDLRIIRIGAAEVEIEIKGKRKTIGF